MNLQLLFCFFNTSSKLISYFCHLNYWCVGINWSNRVVIIIWHLCWGCLKKEVSIQSFEMIETFPQWIVKVWYLHARLSSWLRKVSTTIVAALLFTTAVSVYEIKCLNISILNAVTSIKGTPPLAKALLNNIWCIWKPKLHITRRRQDDS